MPVSLGPSLEPIPGYRLIERLGRGGFGEVWKAEAPGGLMKAIKFVYGDLNASGDGEPAEQELKSLERVKTIRHPYILSLERYDIVDGQLLIVMELADRNLWDRFRECRTQTGLGIPKAELLRYLDSLGIRPGVLLTLGDRAPFEGPLSVRVGETDHQIGHALAAKILVESLAAQ